MVSRAQIGLALALGLLALVSTAEGGVLFSNLTRTLAVEATIQSTNSTTGVAHVGSDHLVVSWALNSSLADSGLDAKYVNVNIKLCYAPVSQTDRGWRKTNNDLHKDKTCGKGIGSQKYVPGGNTTNWRITKDVPGAIYFVRVYAVDADGVQLGFGQTTNAAKSSNLIEILPISGRHASIDVASAIFSVFSVGSLISFLGVEAIRSKKAANARAGK
ncbi:hypothetical protein MPTK1_4g16300 [Marchantia polymorpha subsp. ruderalis]|uniref:High-affinity nitrate transporter n=2 Tax=Marchantia polymorpha TaxID=3197 RepID=A0AAF6BAG6_MARPO|nr:hypothetical protein MARPO_0054s0096 [Marchantia polymorpha]BBN09000.1 hypothetical protein Mp_4g16300 [Marchantia polymorpha subsp. ruderalis]|eukprot:PTQ37989.1 hypothetical protein MARPO_0054s0096 [Marchantia polymorpha]